MKKFLLRKKERERERERNVTVFFASSTREGQEDGSGARNRVTGNSLTLVDVTNPRETPDTVSKLNARNLRGRDSLNKRRGASARKLCNRETEILRARQCLYTHSDVPEYLDNLLDSN